MPESTPAWLSIITVVKDDVAGFARSAASLQGQDLDGVEWVVIDSSDDASQIPEAIVQAGLAATYRWTTPSGIYPAMNAGLDASTGSYAYFLNAGDCLHDDSVLAHVRTVIGRDRPVWLYGQVCFVSPDGRRVTPPPFDYAAEGRAHFSRGRFPPHQGTVASTSALRSMGGFDDSYRIAADYAAFLRLSQLAIPVETSRTLADFYVGGVSTSDWKGSLGEFHRARREILRLSGGAALRERLETAAQYSRMQVARWAGRDGASSSR
jgi:hypothetical protein